MTTFAAIGLDHRHIYHLIGELIAAGAHCAGYWTGTSDPKVLEGVRERFPTLRAVDDRDALLDDPAVDLIVSAAIPAERAALAVQAMRRGKDVLVDKPGVTSFEQLAQVRAAVAETGRIFSICFSERHIVPAVEAARRLVAEGAIGEVVQTVGLGPHRLNRAIRPGWFFDRTQFGGILVDIASHQIDQFLVFTGAQDAQVVHAAVGHHGAQTERDFARDVLARLGELRSTALRLTRSPAAADDLLQETGLRAWRFRAQFTWDSNARAWLHRILVNTFIHGWRRQRREREVHARFLDEPARALHVAAVDGASLGDEVRLVIALEGDVAAP